MSRIYLTATFPKSFPVCLLSCLLLFAAGGLGQSAALLPRGAVWFQTGFAETNALDSWSGKAQLDQGSVDAHAVLLAVAAPENGTVISRRLPVEQVRGSVVRGTVTVKAQNVSAKPNSWNGIKCMLVIEAPSGRQYPQAPLETGTFDWRTASFSTRIPADATNATLVLGLEQVAGKVWFDEVKFSVVRPPLTAHPVPLAGPIYKGHDLPRLRGTMISPGIDAESLRVLGQHWKANLIRWQLIRTGRQAEATTEAAYDEWFEGELKKLDAALPLCEQYGIKVVVDLHSPPGGKATAGGYAGSDDRLFTDPQCQARFIQVWQKIATRYQSAKPIWGYDLVNEPVEDDVAEGCADWQELAERAAKAIRVIDPLRTIIVEPARWGSPEGLNDLLPIQVSNVVYSVHMYIPHTFTHQNVFKKGPSYNYPGEIEGKHWDKAALQRALLPAIEFQKRYNVHIYIGEFSAIRWAPGDSAVRYLSDVIDIFEAHDWDWSYHAFREWNGWSAEHGPDQQDSKPAASPTDRQKLLLSWFAKNSKP